ncbi:hypothetical protein [Rhodococcus sp. (in: high G+C Gram-positive bacteria)]|nr:hypothetical protein [Rhodococcus sp. (in: high G+C Gram-positive bacteria)]MCX6475127.1 hypothetical protein [Rhodococcus sp. (in: high G+C Gram-positive bacteria)]
MLTALLAATAVLALLTLVPGPDMAVVTQAALGAGRSRLLSARADPPVSG